MNIGTWIDPRIASIRVRDVREYLLTHGWHAAPESTDHLLVFEGVLDDDGEPIIQVLPASEHFADYRQRLIELITALSILEERPTAEILNEMLKQSPDQPTSQSQKNGGSQSKKPAPEQNKAG